MSLIFKRKKVTRIVSNGRNIDMVYKGMVEVWRAVRSCFGGGFWVNDRSWDNEEVWKN